MSSLFEGRNQRNKKEPISAVPTFTDSGSIVFPSQKRIHAQLSHVLNVFKESEAGIRPHFHLTGESGSGKSFLVKMVTEELKIPLIEVNAAGLTAEGLSGNSFSKAMTKLREHWNTPNVCLVDEFDKLFQRNGSSTSEHQSSVQDEFLTALESKHMSVFTDYGKYEPTVVNNTLFIFAGAYSNQKIETLAQLKDAGLRNEFIGRVPLVFHTAPVTIEELKSAIPSLDLFQKYRQMFPKTKQNTDIAGIIKLLLQQNEEMKIGIRLLNSVIHQYYMRDV